MPKRSTQIDLLRLLGLALIVLAHVSPPFWLYQLRNFDVPLMVFLSGLGSARKEPGVGAYFAYAGKRFVRLIVPTWIFLTIFFALMAVLRRVGVSKFDYTPQMVATSFLLWGGIGYVWIIRVFFCIALIAPLLAGVCRWAPLLVGVFVVNEALAAVSRETPLLRDGVAPVVSYLGMYLLGAHYVPLSRATRLGIALGAVATVLAIGGWHLATAHRIVPLDDAKYPPHGIYLAYAVAMAIVSMAATARLDRLGDCAFVRTLHALGANTIWIYLWHIPLVIVSGRFGGVPFWARYIVVLGVATAVARVQSTLVHALLRALRVDPQRQRTVTAILCS